MRNVLQIWLPLLWYLPLSATSYYGFSNLFSIDLMLVLLELWELGVVFLLLLPCYLNRHCNLPEVKGRVSSAFKETVLLDFLEWK